MQALQTDSDVNVVSTPHILATDNVEASITVGENVPVQGGYNSIGNLVNQLGGLGSSTPSNTNTTAAAAEVLGMGGAGGFSIKRQNVGLTLNITPQMSDDEYVRLEIELEMSEVSSVDSKLGPNISKKDANTTSIVADQHTVIIGGLITDNEIETTQKVPGLGDIPILGFLFRHKTKMVKKRNLLIFLTPYIIRSEEDFRAIFARKMAERRDFIERHTAFSHRPVGSHVDWSRTNGPIAEINRDIKEAQAQDDLRRQSRVEHLTRHKSKLGLDILRDGNPEPQPSVQETP